MAHSVSYLLRIKEMVEITTTANQCTVRQHRENLGMTIPELASNAGLEPLDIYQIENFSRRSHNISIDVAKRVAGALGVPVDEVAWPCLISDTDENCE